MECVKDKRIEAEVSAMPGSRSSNNESEHKSPRESGDDSEDESEILEESPCGRWLKRKEEVSELVSILCCTVLQPQFAVIWHRASFW